MSAPILIYRLGSLGDTVVALPCFHLVERCYPDRQRIVVTNHPVAGSAPPLEAVVGGSGLITGTISYNVGERSRQNLLRLLLKIRATGAREMIYLTAGRGIDAVKRDIKFFRWCGIRSVIGAPVTNDLHDNRVDAQTGEIEPEALRLARTMAPLGAIDMSDRAMWDMRLTEPERTTANDAIAPLRGQPFIAISIGTKLPANRWEKDNWHALLADLQSHYRGALVGIGADGDFAGTQRLLNRWTGPHLNLCGRLSPRQSAAVLCHARLFIGHDSGPMHLAAAAGAPTIGLFGDNNPPRKWHPFGVATRSLQDMRGVNHVTVDAVRQAVADLLDGTA